RSSHFLRAVETETAEPEKVGPNTRIFNVEDSSGEPVSQGGSMAIWSRALRKATLWTPPVGVSPTRNSNSNRLFLLAAVLSDAVLSDAILSDAVLSEPVLSDPVLSGLNLLNLTLSDPVLSDPTSRKRMMLGSRL